MLTSTLWNEHYCIYLHMMEKPNLKLYRRRNFKKGPAMHGHEQIGPKCLSPSCKVVATKVHKPFKPALINLV